MDIKVPQAKTKLLFVSDEKDNSITLPYPSDTSDASYDKIRRHVERIQWFAIGHGGDIKDEKIVLKYQLEEYVSVVRYLTQFEWVEQKKN